MCEAKPRISNPPAIHTVNYYDAAGTGTVPGAPLTSTANAGSSSGAMLYGSQTKYWTTTNGSYALQYGVSYTPDANYPDSTTQRTYIWQDGALLDSETLVDRNGSSLSGYGYSGAGHIRLVSTSSSGTPRSARYETDGEGRITERLQVIPPGASSAPSDKHYYFGGEAVPGAGPFQGGADIGASSARSCLTGRARLANAAPTREGQSASPTATHFEGRFAREISCNLLISLMDAFATREPNKLSIRKAMDSSQFDVMARQAN